MILRTHWSGLAACIFPIPDLTLFHLFNGCLQSLTAGFLRLSSVIHSIFLGKPGGAADVSIDAFVFCRHFSVAFFPAKISREPLAGKGLTLISMLAV